MKDFISTGDFKLSELEQLIDAAIKSKAEPDRSKPLDGRSVALVFFNPSLRTRASMQVGIYELGGNPVILEPGGSSWTLEHREGVIMDGDKTEHLKEFVRVLERYVSAIAVRSFAAMDNWQIDRTDPIINAFAKYATIPVINLESAMHHPCQAMADMMTIREKLGENTNGSSRKKILLTWAWHPKPLPMAVPNSLALAAAQFGHDLVIARPEGYELDEELIDQISTFSRESGCSLSFTNDAAEGFDGAEVVYAKSWGSKNFYGLATQETNYREKYRHNWIVDEAKMSLTNGAAFMHCLPVRRNVIVTDGVIDSANSIVIEQAENRLHIQKEILKMIAKRF